uniref:Retrovirus-related Pol polyprotein from transposon TNT 1-94 n=1 Tax=Tanacetum cinerariifolium TaxID=118510 RepID=A0A699GL77_TANCI|nr:retrovirus-related Pol polyprotein from transposon TNT 1-94 [Tanacetum cinerariifolium]
MSKGKSEKGLVAGSFNWDEKSISSKDEGVTRVKAFLAIVEDVPSVRKANARLGQRKRKDTISPKEVLFTKANESLSEIAPKITFDTKYSKESGPKVVFGDNSSGDIEGYGSVNCNGITFTRVAYLNGRSSDISYFYVFGCHVHIHNHKDHPGKFNEKADGGFFLGYSPIAKAFRVFNIRRQEMKETYHVTFSKDDEAIYKSSKKEAKSKTLKLHQLMNAYEIELMKLIEALEEIFRNKMYKNGVVIKNKARLVA